VSERRAGQRTSGQTRCRSHRQDPLPHSPPPSVNAPIFVSLSHRVRIDNNLPPCPRLPAVFSGPRSPLRSPSRRPSARSSATKNAPTGEPQPYARPSASKSRRSAVRARDRPLEKAAASGGFSISAANARRRPRTRYGSVSEAKRPRSAAPVRLRCVTLSLASWLGAEPLPQTLKLDWTGGEGFQVSDEPDRDDDQVAREILKVVLANGGAAGTPSRSPTTFPGRALTLGRRSEGWTSRQAEQELENVMADVRRGIWQPPAPNPEPEPPRTEPTFHEFATEWLQAPQRGARRPDDRRLRVEHLLPPAAALRADAAVGDHRRGGRPLPAREGRRGVAPTRRDHRGPTAARCAW
jgi:hypothetical protein